MNDYKDHIRRSMGLTEAQFIPSSMIERDEYPGIDPEDWTKAAKKEKEEHPQLSKADANLIAKQHLQKGEKNEQVLSPTAIPTPILALGIRGSSSGGLPSGADRQGDISPTKVGGYDRVTPQNLNSKLVDKTPTNPEIKQDTPININPTTADGVTHPHQIQVTAHEEPQSVTGASTDSDPTLKLKSAMPKGIDIDIAETEDEEEAKNEDNNTAMIPSTSLSETFERHKKMAMEIVNKHAMKECVTCGCGNPSDDHKPENKSNVTVTKKKYFDPKTKTEKDVDWIGTKKDVDEAKARVCFHCKKPHPCACDKKDEEDAKLQRDNPEKYRKDFGMKIDKRSDLDPRDRGETVECKQCHNKFNYRLVSEVAMGAVKCPACDAVLDQNGIVLEGKHKAGCQCGFCKNMGSFGKKKKEVEEGDEADSMSDQDQELQADRDFKRDKKKEKKDKKEKVDEAKCTGKADCMCKNCKEPDYEDYKKKKGEFKGIPMSELDPEDKIKFKKQQRLDESFAAPFQRMRSLAGIGNMILTSNGLFETKHEPGASKPFNTNWKMDKEKAGFVKIDEEKLSKIKATLERKSKRGTLSDKELQLAKKLDEVLKKRLSALDKQSQAVDKRFVKMEKDPADRPFPFDKDHTGPMRQGNDKGQLPAK